MKSWKLVPICIWSWNSQRMENCSNIL